MSIGRGPLTEVLSALADPVRQHILDTLVADGVGTASTLAEDLPMTRQAVSKHLGVLDRAGLVRGSRIGREVQYEIRPQALEETARAMAALAGEWHIRLQLLKQLAEAPDGEGHS